MHPRRCSVPELVGAPEWPFLPRRGFSAAPAQSQAPRSHEPHSSSLVRLSNSWLDVLPSRAPPPPQCQGHHHGTPGTSQLSAPSLRMYHGRGGERNRSRGQVQQRKEKSKPLRKEKQVLEKSPLEQGSPLSSLGDPGSHSLLLQQERGRRQEGDRCVEVSEADPVAIQQFLTGVTLRLPRLRKPPAPPNASLHQGRESTSSIQSPTSSTTALPHQRGLPCPSVRHRAPCNSCGLLSGSPSLGGTESRVSRLHGSQPSAHGGCSIDRLESGLSDGSPPADCTTSSTMGIPTLHRG